MAGIVRDAGLTFSGQPARLGKVARSSPVTVPRVRRPVPRGGF